MKLSIKKIMAIVGILFWFIVIVAVIISLTLKHNEFAMYIRDLLLDIGLWVFGIFVGLAIQVDVKIKEKEK